MIDGVCCSVAAPNSLLNLPRQLLWIGLMCLCGLGAMPGRRPYLCWCGETDTCQAVAFAQRTSESLPSVKSNLNSAKRTTMKLAKEAEALAYAEPRAEKSLLRN